MRLSTANPRALLSDGICPQCCGVMVLDDSTDIDEEVGWDLGFGLRCLDCGAVCDPLRKARFIADKNT